MKRTFFVAAVTTLALCVAATFTDDGENHTAPTLATSPASTPSGTSPAMASPGLRVSIDPVTREFIEPESAINHEDLPKDLRDALLSSGEQLVEVQNPISGGKMVDLKGQFQNFQFATIDEEGRVAVPCLPAESPEIAKKELPAGEGE